MVLKALSIGGPPPWPALPQHSAWGITLQDGLQEFHLCPNTHSWSPSCLLGAAQPGLGLLGDQLFQDARRCQVLSLNPHFSSPSFQTWVGAVLGGTPDASALGPPGAIEPTGPRLSSVGVLGLAHPGSTPSPPPSPPAPSAQLSRHYPTPPRPATAQGAGSALWGGTCPSLLPHSSKGSSLPFRGHPWGEMSFLFWPLPGAWRMEWGPPEPPVTPCISV